MKINSNYRLLQDNYLFTDVAHKVAAYQKANPDAPVIRLGIGDVTLPLCPVVVTAVKDAVDEMSQKATFRGYGPEQGYDFLRQAIIGGYAKRGVELDPFDIFVSEGAKSDLGNILDIFSKDNEVLVPDPVYPVYVDTNVMDGRRISYMNACEENGFLPLPDESVKADIIYLCSPNNPTGAVYNYDELKKWVDYALDQDAVIFFDAAYESFVVDPDLPHSIYEIEGAKRCAIEFCSFSKTAGFTGTRCAYSVVPKELVREGVSLNSLWLRRHATKFNGVSYIVQKGAAAVYTPEGHTQIMEAIDYYRGNAQLIAQAMDKMGVWYTGGKNSPYIWFKCPNAMESWDFFKVLLERANVVGTPGSGFGSNGRGFFRLTAFGDREKTQEAVRRMEKLFAEL